MYDLLVDEGRLEPEREIGVFTEGRLGHIAALLVEHQGQEGGGTRETGRVELDSSEQLERSAPVCAVPED